MEYPERNIWIIISVHILRISGLSKFNISGGADRLFWQDLFYSTSIVFYIGSGIVQHSFISIRTKDLGPFPHQSAHWKVTSWACGITTYILTQHWYAKLSQLISVDFRVRIWACSDTSGYQRKIMGWCWLKVPNMLFDGQNNIDPDLGFGVSFWEIP